MMKLILSLTLIWMLSSTGGALECYDSFNRIETCQPNESCRTIVGRYSARATVRDRGCSPPGCLNQTISDSLGFSNYIQTTHCCNTSLCNQDLPIPDLKKENGLQCFACEDYNSPVCNKTVQCLGIEDRCFSAIDRGGVRIDGCVSRNLCEAGNAAENGLTNVTCCEGSFCNSARTVTIEEGGALECYDSFNRITTCQPNASCRSVAIRLAGSGPSRDRGCSPPGCLNQTISYSVGFSYFIQTTHCCNTDLCNNQDLPYPDANENGLQCFACEDYGSSVCNKTVQCVGIEDRCMSGRTGDGVRFVGCVSRNLCEAGNAAKIGFTNVTCCESSFCNSARTVTIEEGGALECYDDITSTTTCEPNASCITTASRFKGATARSRGCSPPGCLNQTISYNFGFSNLIQTTHCCNTDLCNNQDLPYPDVRRENGLQCFTCENPLSPVCDRTVGCEGIEDRCFSGRKREGVRFVGCVSRNICEAGNTAGIGFTNVTCCEGSFCNSARTVTIEEVPDVQKEKGLECFANCEDDNSLVCNETVQCVGIQDRCISGIAGEGVRRDGCVARNICEANVAQNGSTNVTCCESSFCNSAWTVKLNVVLLLLGLILPIALGT